MQRQDLHCRTTEIFYGRLTNPTQDIFEQRIAKLEGGIAALAVASGAAAVTYTIQNLAQQGGHIVAAKNIYGGTYNLLAHTLADYGVEVTFVDPLDVKTLRTRYKIIQRRSILKRLEIRILRFLILRRWQRLHMHIKFRSW